MKTLWLLALLLLSFSASAQANIDELAGLLKGSFDNLGTDVDDGPNDRMIDTRIRVEVPQLGEYVFYQQINHSEALEVYRQRILVLSVDADTGALVQHAYALRAPEWFVDAEANAFGRLTMEDLDAFMPDGCEQVWTKTADAYRGYVDPETCRIVSSRTGKPRQIEAESLLGADTLKLAERGYDPKSGEQLFGTVKGEYLVLRRAN